MGSNMSSARAPAKHRNHDPYMHRFWIEARRTQEEVREWKRLEERAYMDDFWAKTHGTQAKAVRGGRRRRR